MDESLCTMLHSLCTIFSCVIEVFISNMLNNTLKFLIPIFFDANKYKTHIHEHS